METKFDYEEILSSYRTYKGARNAITAFCKKTNRDLAWISELDILYGNNKRKNFAAYMVITKFAVIVLAPWRLQREKQCLYEYLDSRGIEEQAILRFRHNTKPLFKRGYSIYGISREGNRLGMGPNS